MKKKKLHSIPFQKQLRLIKSGIVVGNKTSIHLEGNKADERNQ